MGRYIKNVLRFLLFFAAGGVILYFLYTNQANKFAEQCAIDGIAPENCNYFKKLLNDFKSVRWQWLLLVLVFFMASNISRAARWTMMFKPLGYKIKFLNAVSTIMVMYFANLGLPRLGEILRPVALSRYEKIGVEKVIGTIVSERVLDMIMLIIVVGLTLILEYDTLWGYISDNQTISTKILSLITNPFIYLAGILFLLAVVMFFRSNYFRQSNFGKKVLSLLQGLLEGIRSVLKLEKPGLFIFHTIFIWVMYYAMTRTCFVAFEPTSQLGATAALLVFVMGALGIVFPSPGGMGSYHALVMAGLAIYGISQSDAFAYANINFFSIQIFCNVFFGLLAYLLLPLLNKNYEGALQTKNSK